MIHISVYFSTWQPHFSGCSSLLDAINFETYWLTNYQPQVNILEETKDGEQNMFVHHDVPLPDFPLCTAWMDINLKGGDKGKTVAVT